MLSRLVNPGALSITNRGVFRNINDGKNESLIVFGNSPEAAKSPTEGQLALFQSAEVL